MSLFSRKQGQHALIETEENTAITRITPLPLLPLPPVPEGHIRFTIVNDVITCPNCRTIVRLGARQAETRCRRCGRYAA